MDDEDETWLRKFNTSRRSKDGPLSELSFEKIMSNFEDTTNEQQPYLSTDVNVIAPFEEFEPTFEYLSLKALLPYAQHVYLHWKERRIKRQGKPIGPSLKFEESEKDDSNDPYICFRRREVRQVRKTRRQDAVSSERIRRLKAEMQQARDLVAMVSMREKCREEALKAERNTFAMRCRVKEVKRKLAIVGGDEDLVPPKVITFATLAAFKDFLTAGGRRRNLFLIHQRPIFAMPYGLTGPLLVRLPWCL